MATHLVEVDIRKSPVDQSTPLHNRWHPEIPALLEMTPGSDCRLQCLDFTGGQINTTDDAGDVEGLEFDSIHPLTGPIAVRGAKPGDLLVVDILDLVPLETWGFSMIFPGRLRTGLLHEDFPDAAKAIWEFSAGVATSRHVPRVRLPPHMHPGLIGCAPDSKLLDEWNRRESELAKRDPASLAALPPEPRGALLGSLAKSDWARVAGEAARTTAHRENGGNADIKELGPGSRLYLPVRVEGGNLSVGDLHFSMGDGEITAAVEMAGSIDIGVDLISGGMDRYGIDCPVFKPSPGRPSGRDYLTFQGLSVDRNGHQHFLDATLSFEQACRAAIGYLEKLGYNRSQAYMLLACAPIESRISCVCNRPNACCTVAIPTDIFDFDINPSFQLE
jgi:formamidase